MWLLTVDHKPFRNCFPYIDIYYWRLSLQVRYPSVGCRFVVLLVVGTKTNKMARCRI